MNSKTRTRKLKRIAKRLAAYSGAAVATVVASQDRSANAAHVRHDIEPDVTIGAAPGHLFNMVSGVNAVATASVSNATPGSIRLVGNYPGYPNPYIYTPAFSAMGAFAVEVGSTLARLPLGAMIDGNLTFYGNSTYPSIGNYGNLGNWAAGDRGFAGIRFELGGSVHYGWAEVTRDSDSEVTVHAFGYNDVAGEASITGMGAVPEPSGLTLMLLAAGAAGLGLWRRKKSGQAA